MNESEAPRRQRPKLHPGEPQLTEDVIEDEIRAAARGLLAGARVSQAQLAEVLGTSQSSVSHMLTDRESEMTPRELFWIETLCKVRRRGQILRAAGYIEEPTVEDLIYEIPGITAQTAEALAAAVFAVRANILRERGRP